MIIEIAAGNESAASRTFTFAGENRGGDDQGWGGGGEENSGADDRGAVIAKQQRDRLHGLGSMLIADIRQGGVGSIDMLVGDLAIFIKENHEIEMLVDEGLGQ